MKAAASQFLRAVRGDRSQVAFGRRLGYRSNVCTDWEAGRRFPRMSEVFRAIEMSGIDVHASLSRFHEPAALAYRDHGASAWLRTLLGATTHADLVQRTGLSRHRLGRWLRGDAEPRLPDLLALIDALTGRMPDWIGSFVAVDAVPAVVARARAQDHAGRLVYEHPWSPALLTLLSTCARGATLGDLSARLGVPEADLSSAITALLEAKLVRRVADRLAVAAPLTSTVRGTDAERRALRSHWTEVALARTRTAHDGDLVGFNVMAVSHEDLDQIRRRYRDFYREVRSLVAASEPAETAGLLLVHLVEWGALEF